MNESFDRTRRVVTGESGLGPYGQVIVTRRHVYTADEPVGLGGRDTGPDPIEMLMSSLAACTAMTIRMYVEQHALEVGRITVTVQHQWVRDEQGRSQDHFEKLIHVDPMPCPDIMERLMRIAERCPVHRALTADPVIISRIDH